jgi:hypothetical protein
MKQAKATAAAAVTQTTVTQTTVTQSAVTQPVISPTVAQQQSTITATIDTGYDSELAALRQQIGRWFVLLASGTAQPSAGVADRFSSDSYNSDSFAATAGAYFSL